MPRTTEDPSKARKPKRHRERRLPGKANDRERSPRRRQDRRRQPPADAVRGAGGAGPCGPTVPSLLLERELEEEAKDLDLKKPGGAQSLVKFPKRRITLQSSTFQPSHVGAHAGDAELRKARWGAAWTGQLGGSGCPEGRGHRSLAAASTQGLQCRSWDADLAS